LEFIPERRESQLKTGKKYRGSKENNSFFYA
jgi:hypothetical protein